MADKGPGSTGRSNKKRLARAKIKPSDEGIKSSKGRKATTEPELTKTQQKKARQQKITAVAVGIFAVIMALSMMLPSLSYIFGNSEEQQAAQEAAEEEAAAAKEEEEAEAEDDGIDDDLTGVAAVDAAYKAAVDPLKAKLKEDPKDLATLLNLGKDYMAWGYEASSYASEDKDYEHITKLFEKAMDYFDRYLKINDSNAVKNDRAMCQLYTGDLAGAVSELETLTKDSNYAPAWANLGMVYELYQGDTDAAKEAYQKAAEADPDDEYGSKTYANRRLAAMVASQNKGEIEDAASEAAGTGESAPEGASALEEALKAHQ